MRNARDVILAFSGRGFSQAGAAAGTLGTACADAAAAAGATAARTGVTRARLSGGNAVAADAPAASTGHASCSGAC